MLLFYKTLTYISGPFLSLLLLWRCYNEKEDQARLNERKGQASHPRLNGELIWIHAASVGEAQSALILIKELSITDSKLNFLITSGTKTSAELMAKRLPQNAQHQYYPLDNPIWVRKFLNHWKPDLILWMESELWPNMLDAIKQRNITAFLVNARLSDRSSKRWSLFKASAKKILSTFTMILAQTNQDKDRFDALNALKTIVTDNLKYSASPLQYDQNDLRDLSKSINDRPIWVYASTHEGEEALAARIHSELKETYPNLLTIIVPRHPERRHDIQKTLNVMGLTTGLRGENKDLPCADTEIYIADTLGELGLFYRLASIAVIGRSFSNDGGGGHNPIEAAQLNCAITTGPNVQNQIQLFNEMFTAKAAMQVQTEQELINQLKLYLSDKGALDTAIKTAKNFAQSKDDIIHTVMDKIIPLLPNNEKDVS
jgi:3-deoxy-D-manno-octulosonic-acid transferase